MRTDNEILGSWVTLPTPHGEPCTVLTRPVQKAGGRIFCLVEVMVPPLGERPAAPTIWVRTDWAAPARRLLVTEVDAELAQWAHAEWPGMATALRWVEALLAEWVQPTKAAIIPTGWAVQAPGDYQRSIAFGGVELTLCCRPRGYVRGADRYMEPPELQLGHIVRGELASNFQGVHRWPTEGLTLLETLVWAETACAVWLAQAAMVSRQLLRGDRGDGSALSQHISRLGTYHVTTEPQHVQPSREESYLLHGVVETTQGTVALLRRRGGDGVNIVRPMEGLRALTPAEFKNVK